MSEFMAVVTSGYDARRGAFAPGGASLHDWMNGHGPDQASCERAVAANLQPHRLADTMAFMFGTRTPVRPTRRAVESPTMRPDHDAFWSGVTKAGVLR